MTSRDAAARALGARFREAGLASPELDARLLVAAAARCDPADLIRWPDRPLDGAEAARLDAMAARRAAREPVSRILGRREFWGLDFALGPATLDPRPDSETLVETALALLANRPGRLRILDLGTGTGCLLLALLSERPDARGLGVDCAPAAIDVARRNAAALGLAARATFQVGDWGENVDGPFDLVVSNPPYIPSAEIDQLEPDVYRYDPRAALDGGLDGLDAYRVIAPHLPRLLAPGSAVVFEIGAGQSDAVSALLASEGLRVEIKVADLSGIPRAVVARAPRP